MPRPAALDSSTYCGVGLAVAGVVCGTGVTLGVVIAFGVAVGTAATGVAEASGVATETGVGVAAVNAGVGVGLGCMFIALLSSTFPSGPYVIWIELF